MRRISRNILIAKAEVMIRALEMARSVLRDPDSSPDELDDACEIIDGAQSGMAPHGAMPTERSRSNLRLPEGGRGGGGDV